MAQTACQRKGLACDYQETNANLKKELPSGVGIFKVRYRCRRPDCKDTYRKDERRALRG